MIRARILLPLALVLAFTSQPAFAADLVSAPPADFAGLVAVPELDLSGAEPRAREAITSARQQVNAALEQGVNPAELAELYGRLGAYYDVYQIRSGAQSSYQNAMTLDPSVFRWAFLHAYLAHSSGRYEEALQRFRRAAAIDPDYPSLKLYQSEILLEFNRVEEAEAGLLSIHELDGMRARANFRLGQIALQRREYEKAAEYFEVSLAADPEGDAAWFPLAQALRGKGEVEAARTALAKRGKQLPEVGEPLLEQVKDLDRGSRPYYLAGLRAARKGDYTAAADAFEQGVAQDPENPFARISYARALYLCGRGSESREQLEIAHEQAPQESLPLFLIALLDRAAGDEEVAQVRFEQVLEARPDHSGALYFLGLMDFDAGNYPSAAERLQAALASEPGNLYARVLALVALQRSGTPDRVLRDELSTLVSVSPNQWLSRYALARLMAASNSQDVRDVERALVLSRALVDEQVHPAAFEALALAEFAAGNTDAAKAALDQAKSEYLFFGRFPEADRVAEQMRRMEEGGMPAEAWPMDDPLFKPPVISLRGPFMEYPAARAY